MIKHNEIYRPLFRGVSPVQIQALSMLSEHPPLDLLAWSRLQLHGFRVARTELAYKVSMATREAF